MPKGWRKQQGQDQYFRKAKQEGYRARSAYKLLEIDERFHLLRPGATVLDLGAAPGSWSQVASKVAQKGGRVVAVDLLPISPLAGVQVFQGSILDPQVIAQIQATIPNGADVVLSDVSPNISGLKLTDHVRSIELATASLEIALRFLRREGAFVVKVFEGEDLPQFIASARRHFGTVKTYKPEASREESNEQYIVCLRFKPSAPAS